MRAGTVGGGGATLRPDARQFLCDHGAVDVGGGEAVQWPEISAQGTLDVAQIALGASIAAQVGDEAVEQRLDGVAGLAGRSGAFGDAAKVDFSLALGSTLRTSSRHAAMVCVT
jgi:hypothetical protein